MNKAARDLAYSRNTAFLFMPDCLPRVPSLRRVLVTSSLVLLASLSSLSCNNSLGPAVAVTLNLYSIDGVIIPVPPKSPGGKTVTVGNGRLQGTNWGYACGMSLQLIDGPITAADIPDCKLITGEEKKFSAALSDSRFPAGLHEYRFVP